MLRKSETYLMEPVMKVEVVVPEDKTEKVFGELSKRRAQISSVEHRFDYRVS